MMTRAVESWENYVGALLRTGPTLETVWLETSIAQVSNGATAAAAAQTADQMVDLYEARAVKLAARSRSLVLATDDRHHTPTERPGARPEEETSRT